MTADPLAPTSRVPFGLVGYGVGGRLFHAPYLTASPACDLVGILVRDPQRAAQARADNPSVTIYDSLSAMVADGVAAVTISTPPHTRQELVTEALDLGAHVIADKPFAPSAAAARELVATAEANAHLLNVFHNRRFDSDIVTARALIQAGALGDVTRLDLRCDQDDPSTLEAGPTGGLLRDLGSHVVDQALSLLGPAVSVFANLDWTELPGGRTDIGFVLTVTHADGSHSHISSSKLNRLDSRELRVLGSGGSYVSDYSDVQFRAILAGKRPLPDAAEWGLESEERWGILRTTDGEERVIPSERGDYTDLYTQFATAVLDGTAGPVPGVQGVAVLEVLDAARRSAETGDVVRLDG